MRRPKTENCDRVWSCGPRPRAGPGYDLEVAQYDVGTGLAPGALDIYNRYFREAIHPRW